MQQDEMRAFSFEQWFELRRIYKNALPDPVVMGLRMVSSSGRVRDVYEDGTYVDVRPGRREEREPFCL